MNLVEKLKWRLNYMLDFCRMKSMTEMQELIDYAKERNEIYFLEHVEEYEEYMTRPRISRPFHFTSLFRHLEIDLFDKDVLELGPGWGAFLEMARGAEAHVVEYIDYNPYVYTYNRLNGFGGMINDYYSKDAFESITMSYDVIVSRGSINMDRFERQFDGSKKLIGFPEWLIRVEEMCRDGGMIIISPTYDIGDDKANPYLCDEVKVLNSRFYEHMIRSGYYLLSYVRDWSDEKFFPYTYIKRMKR